MFYLAIICFAIVLLGAYAAGQNQKKLSADELKVFRKASFYHEKGYFLGLYSIAWATFLFRDFIGWITPYPFYFVMTILGVWSTIVRFYVNKANLPRQFVKIDNLLFVVQLLGLVPLIFFIFSFSI